MRSIGSSVSATLAAALLALGPFSAAFAAKPAGVLFNEAQEAEKRLQKSPARLKKQSEWTKVARMYRQVVVAHPQSGYSDDSLYFEAELYLEIDRRFKDDAALERALDCYLQVAEGYPASKWARRARLNRGKIFLERLSERKNATAELREVLDDWPGTTEAFEARRILDDMTEPRRAAAPPPSAPETFPPGVVGVRNVRHWTGREYTRIVIDLDEEVKFQEGRLEDPDRIYFDLLGARVTRDLASRSFRVGDGFLQQIRVGQFRNDVVRVVLDFQNVSQYNVFSLPDPYRLVVDILGEAPPPRTEVVVAAEAPTPAPTLTPAPEETSPDHTEPSASAPPAATPIAEASPPPDIVRVPPPPRQEGYSLVQQLGLAASRIVIDPGHGGHDPGTMNKKGLREKDIVLDISQRVRKLLETDGFDVVMTRDSDVFIPLEERTAIANSREADLFVSIHVNASRSATPRGIETYYLNLATTPDAEEVAARENAVTTRRLGELQSILQKVMNNSRITESHELADRVQQEMSQDLLPSRSDARNRGVKTAPFYVLLGAQMPSVLVEVAYLTNRKDAALLEDPAFRQKAAESIASGVRRYQDSLVRTTKADASGARLAEGK
jgi:N-acetylmuramoyl-L-alanine amidase